MKISYPEEARLRERRLSQVKDHFHMPLPASSFVIPEIIALYTVKLGDFSLSNFDSNRK